MSRFPKPFHMQEAERPPDAPGATVLRLSCHGCGRNLADISGDHRTGYTPGRREAVKLTARPGVDLVTEAGTTAVVHSIRCRCGHKHDVRHDRAHEAWVSATRRDGRVIRAVLAGGRIVAP